MRRLRIRKEGDAGPKGGPPGDLYVFLTVKTDSNFKRDGADIYSQVSFFFRSFSSSKILEEKRNLIFLCVPPSTRRCA